MEFMELPLKTAQPEENPDLWRLASQASDGSLSAEEQAKLDALLAADENARSFYGFYMLMHAELVRYYRDDVADANLSSPACGSVAVGEDSAPAVENIEPVLPTPYSVLHTPYTPLSAFLPATPLGNVAFSYGMSAVLVAIGLFIFSLMSASSPSNAIVKNNNSAVPRNPTQPNVPAPAPEQAIVSIARITGMADCVWVNENEAPFQNKIKLHERFALASGLMEITYHTGARVILQGPCTYKVESPAGGYLSLGKLTARVETAKPQAAKQKSPFPLPSSPLFAIRTPTATVTDLGTEFGVEVQSSGETRSHVFEGKVVVASEGASGAQSQTMELTAGQSVQVSRHGVVSYSADGASAALAKNLVRKLPRPMPRKAIHLTDIVAGGDGLGNRCWGGIDAENGAGVSSYAERYISTSANRYTPVTQNHLIDGVFIPNSARGPVRIDSAGHTFDAFAADGVSCGPIWPDGSQFFNMTKDGRMMSKGAVLGGIDYGARGHTLLDLSANKGITFDLDAIRQAHSSWRLVRFLAMTGNTEIATASPGQNPSAIFADIWVFVDGNVCFRKTRVNRKDGAFAIDIPLTDSSRFLTLVGTDGGNGIMSDWIVFGDPRLELIEREPLQSTADNRSAESPVPRKGGK